MIPVTQFILGNSDPLLYPSEKMTNSIDAEIAPLTQEQQNMLLSNQDYVNNYNALQSMVQAEVLNLVRGKIEASEDGKHLLEEQLKLVKLLKSKIVEVTNKEMELFKAFKEASKTNPNLTYEEFLKKYCLMMLNLVMFMLQLTLNIMIMLNYLKNGLVVI